MTEVAPIVDQAATRLAFSLLRGAYLDLARKLRSIDDECARDLLLTIEQRVGSAVGTYQNDLQNGGTQAPALAIAAGQVQAILREAQEA